VPVGIKEGSPPSPIDILGDAAAVRYARALGVAVGDEHSDELLVILTPQDMADPRANEPEERHVSRALERANDAQVLQGYETPSGR
jgi:acetyltransferase